MPRSAKRSAWAVALLAVPLLLVGYVLSVGPVGRLARYSTWSRIYAPLISISDRWPPAFDALARYMVLCGAWTGDRERGYSSHP